jgi:hypothetical protein
MTTVFETLSNPFFRKLNEKNREQYENNRKKVVYWISAGLPETQERLRTNNLIAGGASAHKRHLGYLKRQFPELLLDLYDAKKASPPRPSSIPAGSCPSAPTAANANGKHLPQNFAEATKEVRQDAEQGDALWQCLLGIKYETGTGVPQDYVLAHMWFNLAAAQGDDDALKHRDRMASLMTPDQIAEAQRLAREWKPTK